MALVNKPSLTAWEFRLALTARTYWFRHEQGKHMYLCDSKATERINEFSYIRLLLHYFITPEADASRDEALPTRLHRDLRRSCKRKIDKRLPKH